MEVTKEVLEQLYSNPNNTVRNIAKQLDLSVIGLYRLLDKFNIERRPIVQKQKVLVSAADKERIKQLNLKHPRGGNATKIDLDDFKLLVQSDVSIDGILAFLNISTYKFYSLMKELGLKRLPRVSVAAITDSRKQQVDLSKLSRDYTKYPLTRGEIPPEADLRYLFLELNWDRVHVAQYLGSGKSKKTVAKFLKHYGITKDDAARGKSMSQNYVEKHPEILDKEKNLTLAERGYKNGSQLHISKESLAILNDKNKLEALYKKHPARELGKLLGVTSTTINNYIAKHGIEVIYSRFTSYGENEIKALFPDIEFKKDRTILDGQEIDLYSDEFKIGIEFNGNYWHSDACVTPDYHKKKSELAAKKGVFIFHIFEFEWLNEVIKQAIISRLKNIFNRNKTRVFARKCEIKEVPATEASTFLNANHVQGRSPSQIRLGLYNGTELVALMEFITNGINKKYQYELNRFCCKAGYNVVGGASKLFKHFVKNYKPESVVSYSDIAKTTGNIYKTLGFSVVSVTKPQYHWTNGDVTLSRYECQLKRLTARGWRTGNETEVEVMTKYGFHKIYDCGKLVWGINF